MGQHHVVKSEAERLDWERRKRISPSRGVFVAIPVDPKTGKPPRQGTGRNGEKARLRALNK